jgi:multidrug resistance efflux pump
MDNAKKKLDAYSSVGSDHTEFNRKLEDYESQISDLERKISDAYEKLDVIGLPEVDDVVNYATDYDLAEAKRKYDEANASLTEVTAKYEEAKTKVESLRKQNTADGMVSEYTILLNTYQAELDSLEAQLKQKNKELEAARKELSGAETPADPEDIRKQIEEAEKSIAELEAQLEITKATENKSGQTTEFERADQLKKLDELQKKIEEYKNAPETVSVTAPIAGRIVSVDVVPGDTVTSGNTVARIEIADKGYICEITMSAEEARKIQVGAPCTISNSWWYSEVSASVTQIRSDPQSQGKNRIVVITVNGDVYEGQSLSFTIGDRNQSYDCVLPNSAIREDNDGKFVLTVTSKKTPLGVRYTAVRTNIEVLASDDTKSAVSGLYGSEFVITNATSPISDKQQVRLADENG